jgi:hypothetical protein
VNLKVEDYYPSGKRFLLRFKEKGGKEKELSVHHKLEGLLDEYLRATGLEKEPESPLFPAAIGKIGKLSRRPLVRTDAADMLKRRQLVSSTDADERDGKQHTYLVGGALGYNSWRADIDRSEDSLGILTYATLRDGKLSCSADLRKVKGLCVNAQFLLIGLRKNVYFWYSSILSFRVRDAIAPV